LIEHDADALGQYGLRAVGVGVSPYLVVDTRR
jgi:hypothetical protein